MFNKDFIKRKISLIQDEMIKLSDLAKYTLNEVAKDFVKQAAVERICRRNFKKRGHQKYACA